jgi:cytochrome c biogenesis protein CcdA
MLKLPFQQRAETQLYHARRDDTYWSDIGVGAALGPVFTTCSPTYSLILATIFPVSLIHGIIYLLAYIAGFCSMLILISYFGITLIKHLRWLANPTGMFRKVLGVTFICIGIMLWMDFHKGLYTSHLSHKHSLFIKMGPNLSGNGKARCFLA